MATSRLAQRFIDPELEERLIAALWQDPKQYFSLVGVVDQSVFTGRNADHFAAFVKSFNEGGSLGPCPIEDDPIEDVPKSGRQLAALARRRLLATLLEEAVLGLNSDGKSTKSLVSGLQDGLSGVQKYLEGGGLGRMVSYREALARVRKQVETRHTEREQGKIVGIPTGIYALDIALGSLQTGLHILTGEPGMGKTTFALQVAGNAARHGYPVLFLTFEESVERVALKALCQQAGVDSKGFLEGYDPPDKLDQAATRCAGILERIAFVDGSGKPDVPGVKAKALQLLNQFRMDHGLIVVDYLQQWAGQSKGGRDFRFAVSSLASDLRTLSKILDIPVLALSSMVIGHGGEEEGAIQLRSQLEEAGDLEYAADSILSITRRKAGLGLGGYDRPVTLRVEKNRFGQAGRDIKMVFKPNVGVFEEGEHGK